MNKCRMPIEFKILIVLVMLFFLAACSSNQSSDGYETTPQTPEEVLRATAYVGAEKCLLCHGEVHGGWARTAHAQTLKDGKLEAAYINDSDNSAKADFFDSVELDLAGTADFSKYGENAPRLGSDQAGPYMIIGYEIVNNVQQDKKYYISHTVGGFNNQWKQLYLTKIGNSHYILPVQFNAATKEYAAYIPENDSEQDWYDADNVPQDIGFSRSFERLCAGCHVTGLQLAISDAGEWSMDFVDLGVTCEACHGPGERHAFLPSKENILNPATMTYKGLVLNDDVNGDGIINEDDGNVNDDNEPLDNDLNKDGKVDVIDQLNIRSMLCYACHSRGIGRFGDINGYGIAYPGRTGADGGAVLFMPSLNWADYFAVSAMGENYWTHPSTNNSLAGSGFAGFLASKNHQQHQVDFSLSPHGPDNTEDSECFVCHDMHSLAENPKEHLVATAVNGIATEDTDNNTLCLACHAGREGDFATLTIDTMADSLLVAPKVLAHMSRVGMAGDGVVYDPGGSGQGRCTGCHMPKTGQSAVRDENGLGDISSHTFLIIWPSKNEMNVNPDDLNEGQDEAELSLADLPNACNGCHYNAVPGEQTGDGSVAAGTDQILAWAGSGHGDEDSEAWTIEDWDGNVEFKECQRCHTATGAMNFLAAPTTYDPDNNTFDLAAGENQVLYCSACHSDDNGTLNVVSQGERITAPYHTQSVVTYPDAKGSNMCLVCHVGQESGAVIKAAGDDEFSNKELIQAHYLTAGGQVFKLMGYEFDGLDYANPAQYEHDLIGMTNDEKGPCIGCHLSAPEPDSHFFQAVKKEAGAIIEISSVKCGECHDGNDQPVLSADFLNGQKAGLTALLEVLRIELEEEGFYYSPKWPYFFLNIDNSFDNRVTNWGTAVTGKNNMGAAFNYILILQEQGAYVHNSIYAKRLVFDAVDWLDDGSLSGTINLAANQDAAEYLQDDADTSNDNTVLRP